MSEEQQEKMYIVEYAQLSAKESSIIAIQHEENNFHVRLSDEKKRVDCM